MLRLVTDENFDGRVIRGLREREPSLDLVRAVDVGLKSQADPRILEWAAEQDRVVVSHDAHTMIRFAYDRVRAGLLMPGLIHVPKDFPIGSAIEEILTIALLHSPDEVVDQVLHVPL